MYVPHIHKSVYKRVRNSCFVNRTGVELPATAFNRMCYSYLHNDWVVMFFAGIKLVMALVTIGKGIASSTQKNGTGYA
jgi:hypothetical protein